MMTWTGPAQLGVRRPRSVQLARVDANRQFGRRIAGQR